MIRPLLTLVALLSAVATARAQRGCSRGSFMDIEGCVAPGYGCQNGPGGELCFTGASPTYCPDKYPPRCPPAIDCASAYGASASSPDDLCPCGMEGTRMRVSKCRMPRLTMQPGDFCGISEECASVNCTGNTCVGLPAGASCMGQGCAYGLICGQTFTCVPAPALGAKCSPMSGCAPGLVCDGHNGPGTCVAPLSVANGDTVPSGYQILCASAFAPPANHSVVDATCTPFSGQASGTPCDSPVVRDGGYACLCDYGSRTSGTMVPTLSSGTAAVTKALMTCLLDNKCYFNPTSLGQHLHWGTCAYFKCPKQVAAFRCSSDQVPDTPFDAFTAMWVAAHANRMANCVKEYVSTKLSSPSACAAHITSQCQDLPPGVPASLGLKCAS